MEDDVACETYLARLIDSLDIIIVKFVSRYSKEGHELLANNNYAPRLRYYGPLPDAPPSPPRPENAPGGLALGFMQMVIMDYIATAPTPPTDARQQLHDALSILHAAGYAFGDVREPNVLFDKKDNKIKLIDFNWCGRYNMEVEYSTLPDSIQKMIHDKDSFPTLPLYEYAHYPSNLSTLINWPAGVKSLEQILPRHDWEMWDKLWRSS